MKKVIFIAFLFTLVKLNAQNQEVKKTIEDFFVAFHAKDTIALKSICSNKIIFQSIQENSKGVKLSDELASQFYKSIAAIPSTMTFQEKILSYSIQVDGAMAHVWTPYEFYSDGKLSHKGVNAFTLYKDNAIWKIIYCIDTRRK